VAGMPTAGNVQRARAKQMQEAAVRKPLKAQRCEENERNRLAKEARRGDSSGHAGDATGTPIRRRLMPVYLLEYCARPHGVSRAPRQCRTGVAHRAFGGLTCEGMPGGASQETRPGHHRDAVRTSLRLFWKSPVSASAGGAAGGAGREYRGEVGHAPRGGLGRGDQGRAAGRDDSHRGGGGRPGDHRGGTGRQAYRNCGPQGSAPAAPSSDGAPG
jgi:hypothetical protein